MMAYLNAKGSVVCGFIWKQVSLSKLEAIEACVRLHYNFLEKREREMMVIMPRWKVEIHVVDWQCFKYH